jgi:hypothetical protein
MPVSPNFQWKHGLNLLKTCDRYKLWPKNFPTHFSDDSQGPCRNPLPPEAALLQQEMGDIPSVPRQVRPPKVLECCTQTSNRARHFRRASFVHQGRGSKTNARGGGLEQHIREPVARRRVLDLGVKRLRRSEVQKWMIAKGMSKTSPTRELFQRFSKVSNSDDHSKIRRWSKIFGHSLQSEKKDFSRVFQSLRSKATINQFKKGWRNKTFQSIVLCFALHFDCCHKNLRRTIQSLNAVDPISETSWK